MKTIAAYTDGLYSPSQLACSQSNWLLDAVLHLSNNQMNKTNSVNTEPQ